MRPPRLAAILLVGLSLHAFGDVKLEPNAKITLEFPGLPQTYFSKATRQNVPAILTAQLPENYSPSAKFPIFVFLTGGNGGSGAANDARAIVGPRGFITVSMPLFRDTSGAKAPALPGFAGYFVDLGPMINSNDADALGSSYKVMLQKLFDTVPNITPDRSTLGGFSNGAHATGALIAARDDFILSHFTAYCLFEGGLALAMNPGALDQPALKHSRIIVIFGDHDSGFLLNLKRKYITEPFIDDLVKKATELHLDVTRIVMHGYGHQTPPEYRDLLGNWIRGEKLPVIPPK